MDSSTKPVFEIETAHGYRPLYPAPEARQELSRLIDQVGKWHADHDSDVIGGPILPAWVQQAERRISELQAATTKIPMRGREPVAVRVTAGAVRVDAQIRNRLHDTDPMGGDPRTGVEVTMRAFVSGVPASDWCPWTDARDIFRARDEWAGTGDVREAVYDAAAHLIHAANQRTTQARWNGYNYGSSW